MRLPLISSIVLAAILASCGGATRNYDDFVSTLQEQPAIIDTISSPASYAGYLVSLNDIVQAFEMDDVKLTPERRERIDDLADSIQQLLEAKYTALMQTETAEAEPSDSLAGPTGTVNNL
ncbi:MAG: hypothetical protein K2M04_06955 [Muribaculaceae bacterium]|nr:hypothetical protein [Muribaculaceae bacterium]